MKKRQKVRRAIGIGMLFLFPVTITWLSPALPVIYAMLFGILTGAVIVFLLQFLSSLFFGRAFCAYVCMSTGFDECLKSLGNKEIKNTKINVIKYFIWAPWMVAIIASFVLAGGIKEVDFFAGTVDNWIFLTEPYRYMIYFGVVLLIIMLNIFVGRRAFCHCVCWMAPFMIIGTKFSDFLKLPRLRLKTNQDSCIGCEQCNKKCPMSLDVKTMVEIANMKNSECILCGECVDVCPKNSVTYTFSNKSS